MDVFLFIRASQAPGVDKKRYNDSNNLVNLISGNMARIPVKLSDTLESIKVDELVLKMVSKEDRAHVIYVGTNYNKKSVDPKATFESLGLKQGSTLEVYVAIR